MNLRPLGIIWLKISILGSSCCISCCIISLKHLFCSISRPYLSPLNSNFTNVNIDKNKGIIGRDDIGTLSSPSQLTHNGFYAFVYCSADVNSNLDNGAGNFTDYNAGDFYALLIGGQWQSNGCRYGTLIVTSPRFSGKFWIGRIWDYKFANWHKFSGS